MRLGLATRRLLGVAPNDYVEVTGRRATVAIAQNQGVSPVEEGLANAEAVIGRNAGAKNGENVELRRVELPAAERLTIAPIYSGSPTMDLGPGLESFVAKALSRRPFVPGDVFVVPGVYLQGGSLLFRVMDTAPRGPVAVGPATLVTIINETVPEMVVVAAALKEPRDSATPPEVVEGPKLAKELEEALRAYHLLARFSPPSAREAAAAWWSEAGSQIRNIREPLAIEAKWQKADEQWEREHPKPPNEPEFDEAWLARDAAARAWSETHRDPLDSPEHLRARQAALRAMESWALATPAPTLSGDLYDKQVAEKVGRAMIAAPRRPLEDQPGLEAALRWSGAHPEPPLPPGAPATPGLEWHLAFHAWQDAHPHVHESAEETADRRQRQVACEARWRRLAAKYP